MLGSLASLYNGNTSNRVYQPPGNSWMSNAINESGGGIAGAQAVAMQLYDSSQQRYPLLQQLQALLGVTTDPAERETLIARIGMEQAYIQNAQVQAQALGNYMQAELANRDQRGEERLQKSIDNALQDAVAHGVWPANAPGPQG
jgi:hypothetical protein